MVEELVGGMDQRGVEPVLRSASISTTRDLTAASGDVAYGGLSFQPNCVIAFACIPGAKTASWGFVNSGEADYCIQEIEDTGNFWINNNLVKIDQAFGADQRGEFKQFDADGFQITWTKTGLPVGDAELRFLCLR